MEVVEINGVMCTKGVYYEPHNMIRIDSTTQLNVDKHTRPLLDQGQTEFWFECGKIEVISGEPLRNDTYIIRRPLVVVQEFTKFDLYPPIGDVKKVNTIHKPYYFDGSDVPDDYIMD